MAKTKIYKVHYAPYPKGHSFSKVGKSYKYIIYNGYRYLSYKNYSSKQAAINGRNYLRRIFINSWGASKDVKLIVIKTNQGWGVWQLPKKGYRMKTDGSVV